MSPTPHIFLHRQDFWQNFFSSKVRKWRQNSNNNWFCDRMTQKLFANAEINFIKGTISGGKGKAGLLLPMTKVFYIAGFLRMKILNFSTSQTFPPQACDKYEVYGLQNKIACHIFYWE